MITRDKECRFMSHVHHSGTFKQFTLQNRRKYIKFIPQKCTTMVSLSVKRKQTQETENEAARPLEHNLGDP